VLARPRGSARESVWSDASRKLSNICPRFQVSLTWREMALLPGRARERPCRALPNCSDHRGSRRCWRKPGGATTTSWSTRRRFVPVPDCRLIAKWVDGFLSGSLAAIEHHRAHAGETLGLNRPAKDEGTRVQRRRRHGGSRLLTGYQGRARGIVVQDFAALTVEEKRRDGRRPGGGTGLPTSSWDCRPLPFHPSGAAIARS